MSLFCSSVGVIEVPDVPATVVNVTREAVVSYIMGGTNPFSGITWEQLPHCVSAELTPNTETPNKIRTSDTNGIRVSPGCGALTEYELTATNALDMTDWLRCYLLETPTDPGTGITTWARILPLGAADTDGAIYCKVKVNPGGYGFDNDSNEAVTTEWSAELLESPVYPFCGADTDITDDESDVS